MDRRQLCAVIKRITADRCDTGGYVHSLDLIPNLNPGAVVFGIRGHSALAAYGQHPVFQRPLERFAAAAGRSHFLQFGTRLFFQAFELDILKRLKLNDRRLVVRRGIRIGLCLARSFALAAS